MRTGQPLPRAQVANRHNQVGARTGALRIHEETEIAIKQQSSRVKKARGESKAIGDNVRTEQESTAHTATKSVLSARCLHFPVAS